MTLIFILTQYAEFSGEAYFFHSELRFPKIFGWMDGNCNFKLKLYTKTNLNTLNSILMCTLSSLDQKYHFYANLDHKFKNLFLCFLLNLVLIFKVPLYAKIWCQAQFKYAKLNIDAHVVLTRNREILSKNSSSLV